MKLIKLMLAIVMALAMVVAQDTGDNPCDPNMTYPAADPGPDGGCGNYADCNGNGAYDLGEPCFEDGQDGGPPFEAVDTNGDGVVDRDEARAMFGQDDEGNPDPEFDAEYDRIAGDDGVVDHDEYMAADDGGGDHEGGDGQDGGPPFEAVDTNGDGSIDRDEARAMFGQDDEGNPDPEFDAEYDRIAGDDGVVDHDEYMAADDGGGDHEGGDGDDGPPPFEDVDSNGDGSIDRDEARDYFGDEPNFDEEYDKVDTNGDGMVDHDEYMAADDGGPPTNHWDGNCGAMSHGESEYWLDSDGDPNNGAEDGPYAVWYEDADGNSVDCGPGPDDGNQN